MTDHLRLDLDLVELLSGVDTNNRADHLWDDNHVTQVRLDDVWLLVGLGLLLSLTELLDQTHGLALETAVETATGARVDDVAQLVGREVEQSERGLAGGSPLYSRRAVDMYMGIMGMENSGLWVWEVVLLEVYAAVGELAERSLLLDLGSLSCVLCAKTCQLGVPLEWLRAQLRWIGLGRWHSRIRRQP